MLLLVAVCALGGRQLVTSAEIKKNETAKARIADSEKPKRDLNIIGPLPSSYRGQATGRTTFDGILADDLQLPAQDSGRFRPQSFSSSQFGRSRAQNVAGSESDGFGQFQAESRPEVYNVDGKEHYTYDGVLASDLMVPYPQFTMVNQAARSAQQQYFGQRLPQTQQTAYQPQPVQPVVRQANFASTFEDDLTLPAAAPGQLQAFQQSRTVPSNSDPSLFTPETPLERYNRLQQQYQATLAEYRSSLLRFREQLKKYSNFSQKK